MNIPVRLFRRTRDGAIVETLAPGDTGVLLYGAGTALPDSMAEASGVAAYLRSRGAAQRKAVDQAEVEDKSVDQAEVEDKGLSLDRPRARR